MNTDRRHFLKIAGISAFALSAGLAGRAAEAAVAPGKYEHGPNTLHAGRWGMVIDTRKFPSEADYLPLIKACHEAHNVPNQPGPHEIKWMWLAPYKEGFPDDENHYGPEKFKTGKFPLLCNHCENPPCVRVCPTKATYKMEDGIVAMDYHRCIGCRFCMAACPFGARSFNFIDPRIAMPSDKAPNPAYPTRMPGVVEKCTFCAERLAAGKLPACVEASGGKILFGDLNNPKSDVRKALAENFSIRRKPSLGTQPGVYYLV
ncbi:MAG: 4Fe-4S dicluster domain-containing protein [Betaproteobacteria bacterium]|nr:4Fe-4S dicluster domain-containing protein [Betaproteobacteria bacterium]